MLWTLLIFVGCFYPAHELPHVDVPFVDKWTHFVLFGVFSFLWLCARPKTNGGNLLYILAISVVLGCLIEVLQGQLTFLGRSMELMDAVADSVGGLLGIAAFMIGNQLAITNSTKS
jgi:VanZ family protein